MREVRYEYSPQFPAVLAELRSSLLVSTYQAGKLGVFFAHHGQLQMAFHQFDQAMGVAIHPRRLVVGTRAHLWFMNAAHDLAPRIEPAGTHDACYLARTALVTGNIHGHELVYGATELWLVNTLFSSLVTLSEDFSFVPRWRPPFVTTLVAEDRCHLNGVAMRNGRPAFVTAMAESNEPAGWRPTKATSGIVIDVDSGSVVTRGLAMPHSPRYYADRLWVLDSGKGQLATVDLANGSRQTVTEMPGYTRGLAFCGPFAFVGLSRIRETAVFGGMPVAERHPELKCGIGVVDLRSGQQVAALQFHSGVEEIFDVQVLPGIAAPYVNGPHPTEDSAQTIWLVPSPGQEPPLDGAGLAWLRTPTLPTRAPAGDGAATGTQMVVDNPRALVRRGLELHENGRVAAAVECYRQALALAPGDADALNNLGNALQDFDQRDEAIKCYRRAIELQPRFVFAYRNLGYVLKEEGKTEEGLEILKQAQQIEPNDVIRFVIATSLPPVYQSLEHLQTCRQRLLSNVQQMVDEGFSIDVTRASAPTMFYGAYQGANDRDLQRNLASLFRAPQVWDAERSRPQRDRIHIGMISRHFRNHTIGRLNLGLVRHLPRDKFHVTVVSVGHFEDVMARGFAAAADRYVELPTNLGVIREHVAQLDLDLLMFSDVGMDTLTYTLALSRFAPVQCVTWGHPVTTGSRAMDYFISSRLLEVPEADEHYTENLVRLPVVNVYYERPEPPPARRPADFGLSDDRNIYLCFQNLFKIHPEFDAILAGILARDPRAEIVMMQGKYPQWTQLLRERLERTIGSAAERIRFLPTVAHPEFLALNALAHVSLDPIHFGGGNTTYEALAMGLPVVTWPSRFLRCRISYALYQQMGLLDCVVDSAEAYVDLAVRLGTDRDYRQHMSQSILDRCDALYSDMRAIEGHADFFEKATQALRTG